MNLRPLLAHPIVRAARARVLALDEDAFQKQLEIVQIAAPPFAEETRGRFVAAEFARIGLSHPHRDDEGNVLARLEPADGADSEPVVVAAHLDTVFPETTDLRLRRQGRRVYAPGIADNARGLAAMLVLARALVECGVRPRRPIVFVGTVGEEGIGDLRGVKHLFREESPLRQAAGFISLDGSGVRRVVHRAIGARRLRATATGPGGHSWSDWGVPNPLHALGSAIHDIQRVDLRASAISTVTVARVAGGTSVNAIPDEAWLELDMRSEEPAALARIEADVRRALASAVDGVNRMRRPESAPLELRVEVIGDRPSGAIPETADLVQAAIAATRAVGARPELAASSTDANVPIALGIPAVTLGAGGESGGIHTTEEWFSNRDGGKGLERGLLTLLAAAGVADAAP